MSTVYRGDMLKSTEDRNTYEHYRMIFMTSLFAAFPLGMQRPVWSDTQLLLSEDNKDRGKTKKKKNTANVRRYKLIKVELNIACLKTHFTDLLVCIPGTYPRYPFLTTSIQESCKVLAHISCYYEHAEADSIGSSPPQSLREFPWHIFLLRRDPPPTTPPLRQDSVR